MKCDLKKFFLSFPCLKGGRFEQELDNTIAFLTSPLAKAQSAKHNQFSYDGGQLFPIMFPTIMYPSTHECLEISSLVLSGNLVTISLQTLLL